MSANEGKTYWRGEFLSPSALYAKGVDDEHKRSSTANRATVQNLADDIRRSVFSMPGSAEVETVPPTWWPHFTRAAAHVVLDPTGAPAGSGQVEISPDQFIPLGFSESFMADAMPCLQYSRLIEALPGQPIPVLPMLSTPATAGPRAGEKVAVYSKAFDITPATATEIDSGLNLNVSQVILDMGDEAILNLIMRAAVAAEGSRQVAAAIETAAAGTGMANFSGRRYVPKVIVVPPVNVATLNAANYVAAGMTVVIDTNVTKTLVVDPNAILGYFKQGKMTQFEPSLYGVDTTWIVYGKVAVDPAGVAALTPGP